jgi:hypothetical protein
VNLCLGYVVWNNCNVLIFQHNYIHIWYYNEIRVIFFLFPTLLYNGHVIYWTEILAEFFLYLDHTKLSPLHTQHNQLQHHISPTIMDLILHQSQCSSTLLNKFIFIIYIPNMNQNYFFKFIRHTIGKKEKK